MAEDRLAQECLVFSRYLTGLKPSAYTLGKYREYHDLSLHRASSFDRLLVDVALLGNPLCWLADAYCTRFRKQAELRRKLVLTLALLECSPRTSRYLDTPGYSGQLALVTGLGIRGGLSILASLVSAILLEPVRFWYRVRERGRASE